MKPKTFTELLDEFEKNPTPETKRALLTLAESVQAAFNDCSNDLRLAERCDIENSGWTSPAFYTREYARVDAESAERQRIINLLD